MSGDIIYEAPRKYNVSTMRVHDYLYDTTFIVSGARDYARTAFKAAMNSAQVTVHPVYKTMFSKLREHPRVQVVYHPNCRLPEHVDRSYEAYVDRVREVRSVPAPELAGRDRFKYCDAPKKVLHLKSTTPNFNPETPPVQPNGDHRPRNRGTQSVYRESSAQTIPWQAEARVAEGCKETPEVLYLDNLEWGPGCPYRKGDLPADFHTTEIINKMRHARKWMELVEKGQFTRCMKSRDEIIRDVETRDWLFREAEIDELQDIRLMLLHRQQSEQRQRRTGRIGAKLAKLWTRKKQEMERKIENIRRARDRELRKLSAQHNKGGKVQEIRAARGGGSPTIAAFDPTSELRAPLARHGYQARRRHAEITYDPSLLVLEDHMRLSAPPAWLERCGQDLKHTCSGGHLPRDITQLCERETKWSEQFLESLHNDLKKARLGASVMSAGPLRVLKPRRLAETPRPATPEVEAVDDEDEENHQAALLLQKIIRGRAVQNLMFEGRTRAAELTEELKTTHGLQKEDKIRIAKEEAKAREHSVIRTEAEQKEDAISALVDELCGGAVAAALDFLEKELRRLKEERKQHAFILIALREKTMREAAEAGRRQKEEHRRREHDEMFKRVLGVTQETVDSYLREIVQEGVELAAEEDAVKMAQGNADRIEESIRDNGSMSTAEQNELVAELVQQFLLPEAHKAASRHRIATLQEAKMEAARQTIFGLVDDATIGEGVCIRCGAVLDEQCRCVSCRIEMRPEETVSREDPRWRHTRRRPVQATKSAEERFPLEHEIRCTLNDLVHEAVSESRRRLKDRRTFEHKYKRELRERCEVTIDARQTIDEMINRALGASPPAPKRPDYHHFMTRRISDALARTEKFSHDSCPKELPSEIRRRREKPAEDMRCKCDEEPGATSLQLVDDLSTKERSRLLPSELRALEDMKRCKCDYSPSPGPRIDINKLEDEITRSDTEESVDQDMEG